VNRSTPADVSRPTRFPRFFVTLLAAAAALQFILPLSAQQWRTGRVAEVFQENCASCHGSALQGGSAPSMLDDDWAHGGSDVELERLIREGNEDQSMPGWGPKFSDREIRALVTYIREVRAKHRYAAEPPPVPQENLTVDSKLHRYRLATWVDDLSEPWSLAFLPGPGDRAVVTEKRGRAYVIEQGRVAREPMAGLPTTIESGGQGGLYDVVPHPDFVNNGWLYFAYADLQPEGSLTRVIRGRLRDNTLVDQQVIFEAPREHYVTRSRSHWGGRIVFDRAGFLYFTHGERNQRQRAQDLASPLGKVHRLHDDGRIPADNPFVKQAGAMPSVWTYGHRNPQGLALDPATGDLYDLEHGPRGGDELNLLRPGANYGWPVITYGIEYSGAPIAETTHREGMEQPVTFWTPSLGVCGMNFYAGDLFPRWKNHLFFASLSAEELRRVEVRDGRVVDQEIIFKNIGRVRHVIGGPDGALYVLLPKRIARLTPAD
jgi:glucose/arabinose dehydrogenase/cytochrome c5